MLGKWRGGGGNKEMLGKWRGVNKCWVNGGGGGSVNVG